MPEPRRGYVLLEAVLIARGKAAPPLDTSNLRGIQCLTCGVASWNRNDVAQRYCPNCHVFHEDATR